VVQVFRIASDSGIPVHPEFRVTKRRRSSWARRAGWTTLTWAKRLGVELSEEQSSALLQEVKLMSHDLKRVISEDEFRKLAKKVKAKS
jgi:hypothetical protein